MRDALIVFGRVPIPGKVKTRLTPFLSEKEAAELYGAFVHDTLERLETLSIDIRLYLAEPVDVARTIVKTDVDVFAQRGEDLGARMRHAFIETFAAGYERVAIVGTDHPTLPNEFISMAFESLVEPLSVCIGPSHDGGYYLLGLNDLFPDLFVDIVFSRPDVFQITFDRATRLARCVAVLPEWYDVDRPEDLSRLADDLADAPHQAPRSSAFLQGLGARL